jgi:hypothetical protein
MPLALVGTGGTKPVISGLAPNNYIIKVDATTGVTLDNLVIDGGGSVGNANNFTNGVLVNDSGTAGSPVEIKNSAVQNIWSEAETSAIEVDSTSIASPSYVLIHDSTISFFWKNGIRFVKSSGHFYNNQVIGHDVNGVDSVQNLVNLRGGSNVEIDHNTLHNALVVPGATTPIYAAPAILVSAYNSVLSDQTASHANIHNNQIYNDDTGIIVGSAFTGGSVDGTDHSTATISNNNLHDLNIGINFEQSTASATVSGNSFTNIATLAMDAEAFGSPLASPPTITAINNWWGTVISTEIDAKVVGSVDYTPWYTNPEMTTNSTERVITSFNLSSPSVAGTIDNTAHTVTLTVPHGTDVTALTPTIATSTGAAVSPASGSAHNFTSPVTYTVTSADGTIQAYIVTVNVVAANQTVPDASGSATVDSETPNVVITDPDQAVTVTVGSGTTNATVDVGAFITDGTGVLPQITIESDNADIAIPGNTTVTSEDTSWDGVITAPTITTVTLPETAGETKTLSTAIEIGFSGAKLSFDKAVRILLPGQTGKKAGYVRTGIAFTEITNLCVSPDNQAAIDADLVGPKEDCKIDVGADMVIWTKHFTKFATYTQATTPVPAPTTTTTTSTSSKPVGTAARGTGAGVLGESSNAQIATPLSTTVKELPAAVVAAPAVEKATHLKWYWYVAIVALAMVTVGVYYVYQAKSKKNR